MSESVVVKGDIRIEDGDGIEIGRHVEQINMICCKCGLKHSVEVEWKQDSIILRFTVVEGCKEEDGER